MPTHAITSEYWTIETDPATGAIVRIRDVKHERELIADPASLAWILETDRGEVDRFRSLETTLDPEAIRLVFTCDEDIVIRARIGLNAEKITFSFRIENGGSREIRSFEYPILYRLTSYENTDVLAHSYATGLLIERPTKNFNDAMKGLRYAPYPESFSGSSLQFFAYYGESGGFLMMAEDPDMHQKWLNVYYRDQGLVASHIYGYEHIASGNDLFLPYEVSIRAFQGDWMDAADIYKAWATEQPFVPRPTLERRHAKWLYQDIGLATFGINAKHDRTVWLERYHRDLGLPIFHILGPDWTNHIQDFGGVKPGGLSEWLPTRFSNENLAQIRANGDYVAPFEFDFLVNPNGADHENLRPHMQAFPDPPKSHDGYRFNMLCPANAFTKDFHVERDLGVLKESGVDSIYYDISSNNLIKTCLEKTHDHDQGGGYEIARAYNAIYRATKEALEGYADKPIPLGAEMANEIHLDTLDYVQARSWAQPASTLETYPFRKLILDQDALVIPMFSYVYHEYGLLRLDGWGKIVEEIGSLFFNTVARTYLFGGVYEINHEYSPMEAIDGRENDRREHYADFARRGYAYAPKRMSYLRQFAALRTKEGNPFLAYGRMMRPLSFASPETTFDYFHYNHDKQSEAYEARGTVRLDAVVHSAFERIDRAERAYFFANTSREKSRVELTIPGDRNTDITLMKDFDPARRTTYQKPDTSLSSAGIGLTLEIDPHRVIMIRTNQQGGS
ncbi:MAG: DUF6259 domain-containing protein [Acholeplasmataceae bacterium]